MTNFASFLACLAGAGAAVLLIIVGYRPARKRWVSISFQGLGLGVGMWLGRFLFLGTYYVLLWMVLFGLLGNILGTVAGLLLEKRLKLKGQ
jgi:hypothetical protein